MIPDSIDWEARAAENQRKYEHALLTIHALVAQYGTRITLGEINGFMIKIDQTTYDMVQGRGRLTAIDNPRDHSIDLMLELRG